MPSSRSSRRRSSGTTGSGEKEKDHGIDFKVGVVGGIIAAILGALGIIAWIDNRFGPEPPPPEKSVGIAEAEVSNSSQEGQAEVRFKVNAVGYKNVRLTLKATLLMLPAEGPVDQVTVMHTPDAPTHAQTVSLLMPIPPNQGEYLVRIDLFDTDGVVLNIATSSPFNVNVPAGKPPIVRKADGVAILDAQDNQVDRSVRLTLRMWNAGRIAAVLRRAIFTVSTIEPFAGSAELAVPEVDVKLGLKPTPYERERLLSGQIPAEAGTDLSFTLGLEERTAATAELSVRILYNDGRELTTEPIRLVFGDVNEVDRVANRAVLAGVAASPVRKAPGAQVLSRDNAVPATPTLTVGDASTNEGDSGTTAVSVTVTRAQNTSGTSSVHWATVDGSAKGNDFEPKSGDLTFAAGDTSMIITVRVKGDTVEESTETFSIQLSQAQGANIAKVLGVVTIVDNDRAGATLAINDVSAPEGNVGTTPFRFTITRAGSTAGTSTVQWATQPGNAAATSDYVGASATVTFAPGEASKTVSVVVRGDAVGEGNETFSVVLSSPTGAVISDSTGIGTILDDDN